MPGYQAANERDPGAGGERGGRGMSRSAEDVLPDPLEPSPVYLERGERTALLKRDLKRELSPTEPLRSNIKQIGFGSKGNDYVLIKMRGFTDDMAERLSEFVEGWHISMRNSDYTGVGVYAKVDYDP